MYNMFFSFCFGLVLWAAPVFSGCTETVNYFLNISKNKSIP